MFLVYPFAQYNGIQRPVSPPPPRQCHQLATSTLLICPQQQKINLRVTVSENNIRLINHCTHERTKCRNCLQETTPPNSKNSTNQILEFNKKKKRGREKREHGLLEEGVEGLLGKKGFWREGVFLSINLQKS